jgi:putative chitinase
MTLANRIKSLQSRLGVPADGVVGPVTVSAVERVLDELDARKSPPEAAGQPGGGVVGGASGVSSPGGASPGTGGHKLALPDKFYAAVRRDIFGGKVTTGQFEGIEALLEAMSGWPLSWVAYGLATAKLETAATMQPIKERGGAVYFKRMYDIEGERPGKARELGNLSPGDGAKYAGRGYVQLTGKSNYAKAAAKLGLDLIGNPDLAMEPAAAAKILRWGMSEGAFTSRKLGDYLAGGHGSLEQFKQARRIINGQDRAVEIARIAEKFQAALQAGGWA